MRFVEMTVDEAMRVVGKDAIVYVSIASEEEHVTEFVRQTFSECEDVIRRGNKIRREADDMIDQLRVLKAIVNPHKTYKSIGLVLLPNTD